MSFVSEVAASTPVLVLGAAVRATVSVGVVPAGAGQASSVVFKSSWRRCRSLN